MERSKHRGAIFKLAILWLVILLLGSFWLTMEGSSQPVDMVVLPQVPREGEPVVATFKLNNPSSSSLVIKYQFYADGELLKDGATSIAPDSGKTYKYAYENPLEIGQQLNFMVRTQSELGNFEKLFSFPSYPPQIWSSFVSFASFSTSVMTSMSTMTYYQSTFSSEMGFNIGLLSSIVLIGLLIFLELTRPVLQGKTIAILGRLTLRFSTVTWILLLIFIGIVYTRVVMVLIA